MIRAGDLQPEVIQLFLKRLALDLEWIPDSSPITASYWGDPEAGVSGRRVFVRSDTPIHSVLHEASHVVCMTEERRQQLDRDAGGDDFEEAAVCYLQLVFADYLDGVDRHELMRDMDAWGYSFRLGSTARWFAEDAEDARAWLVSTELITESGVPTFRLRVN